MKLETDFYLEQDVIKISRALLGKVIFSRIDRKITAGVITETEAYAGISDQASHAYGGRFTRRTRVMYMTGGTAYVYLCYGIHSLFNIVTNAEAIPHAVLVRSISPFLGLDTMLQRRGCRIFSKHVFTGPGKVSQALGIQTTHSGISLTGNRIWIEDHGLKFPDDQVSITPRIGVEYAGKDAALPYRFVAMYNHFLSF